MSKGITSRAGDKGRTSLLFGVKLNKDDPRIELLGDLDELCSYSGLCKSLAKSREIKGIIESIQKDILSLCAEVASGNRRSAVDWEKKIQQMEVHMEHLQADKPCKCFVLPGRTVSSSALDVARCVARRAERKMVSLKRKGFLPGARALAYLNRLSDLLYLLARKY